MVSLVPFAEDVRLSEQKVLFVLNLDLAASVLGQENLVAFFDSARYEIAGLVAHARAYGYYGSIEYLALGLLRQHDTSFGLSLACESLYQYSVE